MVSKTDTTGCTSSFVEPKFLHDVTGDDDVLIWRLNGKECTLAGILEQYAHTSRVPTRLVVNNTLVPHRILVRVPCCLTQDTRDRFAYSMRWAFGLTVDLLPVDDDELSIVFGAIAHSAYYCKRIATVLASKSLQTALDQI